MPALIISNAYNWIFELSWSSIPSVYIYAGTQQFTKSYLKKNNFLIFLGFEEAISEPVNKFSILSFEISAPIVLAREKWQLILLPAYVFPQNLIVVSNRPDLSESGKNMFYATLGAKFTL